MKFYHALYFILCFFLFSCNKQNKNVKIHTIKVTEAKGYILPQDSILKPKTILSGTPKIVKVGNPKVIAINTNIHLIGSPEIVLAGKPQICILGQDRFLLAKTVLVKDSSFLAGIPEIVIAKDMANKDQNPQNFSTYGKLQGLKHGQVNCILEDKSGNIWFGTNGGLSKYDGKFFTNFTDKEGLKNNDVRSILQDKSGNLWFGTLGGGVSKYDGKFFINYTEKEGLCHNFVFSILEDKSGNLWFGTYGGITKYDGKSFTNFTEKEGLCYNDVRSLLEDNYGNIWAGTFEGVSKFNGKSFANFTIKEGLSDNVVMSMVEDKDGNLWFATNNGISKFDGKYFTNFTSKEGLSHNFVFSVLEDESRNLWFGTYGGISKYDGKSFTNFTEKDGLSQNDVRSILEDKSGNLWFGTLGSGVSKYDRSSFMNFTDKEGLSNNFILAMLEDKSGNLWFGSYGGLTKYNRKSFTNFTDKEGLINIDIRCILEDKYGSLWLGSEEGVIKYDGKSFINFTDNEGLSHNDVRSILEDKYGNLWFGTNGGISKYDGKTFTNFTDKEGLIHNFVFSMLEDKSGNIWFGTYGGLSKYDGKTFTNFTDKDGLSHKDVRSILEDKSGNLWFGTAGGGVTKYDGKSFTNFTTEEGLCNNFVLSMLEDKSGNIWFGTRFGLSKLSPLKLAEINNKIKLNNFTEQDIIFKNYTYTDGFLGIGVNGGKSMLQDKEGIIWIGANDRLSVLKPKVKFLENIAPNVQLTSIELFNENISWNSLLKNSIQVFLPKDTLLTLGNGVNVSNFNFDGLSKWYSLPQNLSLSYNNNYLTFNFVGITMNQPKSVKYQYILEGIDENWSAVTFKTSAPYGNLPSGVYNFKVKAMNSEGFWSAPFEYKFTIRPPFWQIWWFRLLIGLLIIGSIWYYIKSREQKLVIEKENLEKTVLERTVEVVEQKNLIEKKHKEITDSINYAERIQRSFLATKEILDENLNDYFVLFKPKEVVSGDFYWASILNNGNFALVTADSTGHGVPGSIMSLLNITSLEKAVEHINNPSEILNHTRATIINRLRNDGSADGGKDGMDASLLVFDFKQKQVHIAAANNPVWIFRSVTSSGVEKRVELIEIKPDKMPIGKHDKDSIPFTQHTISLNSGDVIYTITDGYADQFGGEKEKKFMIKNLKKILTSNCHLPMQAQKELLDNTFNNWVGNLEQVDDVTIIGVRI